MPPATLDKFRDHGKVAVTLTGGLADAHAQINQLGDLGISLDAITNDLEKAGIQSFVDAFDRLLTPIDSKRKALS